MQASCPSVGFDCFKWDFVIFGIVNEYEDVYDNLDELKSDFNWWICEEKIDTKWFWDGNRPKIRVCFGLNWKQTGNGKNVIFGGYLEMDVSFQ